MADKFVYNVDMKNSNMKTGADLPARDRILLTAHDLFYGEGIRATGINRVIAESGVTKVTFYRHFPSKNDLIMEFLEYRHQRWMAWFVEALQRHGGDIAALAPTLGEWFRAPHYRGCTFINSVGELGSELPETKEIARRHKHDMMGAIATLLPSSTHRDLDAQALAMAVDGAIVRSQFDPTPDAALLAFEQIVQTLVILPSSALGRKDPDPVN